MISKKQRKSSRRRNIDKTNYRAIVQNGGYNRKDKMREINYWR